jgi:hypothetical protein
LQNKNIPTPPHAFPDTTLLTNVGAGLPAIAMYQLAYAVLTRRHRRQASSHLESAPTLKSPPVADPPAGIWQTLRDSSW